MEKITIERIVNNFKNEVEMRKKVDEKYNQTFKDNYQYVINLKNTKNHLVLNFITKGTKLDKDFISEYEKIDDGKTDWKVLDYILRNSYICYVEGRKINHKFPAYLITSIIRLFINNNIHA